MKKTLALIILCFSVVISATCDKNPVDADAGRNRGPAKDPVDVPIELNKEFTLKLGQTAALKGDGLRLTFADVPNESRCPLNLRCIWEGNARIELQIADVAISLNTAMAVPPQEADYGNYRIRMLALTPHPVDGEETDKRKYEATLIATRIRP